MKNEPIINSMLDNDLYKVSMLNFVLQLFPDTEVTYKFNNRSKQKFNEVFLAALYKEINENLPKLKVTQDELNWMKNACPYLPITFFEYFKNFKFNPDLVKIEYYNGTLDLTISGLWRETILYEVPLLAIISELYFKHVDTNWNMDGQKEKLINKAKILNHNNCHFSEFGTRRRRNFEVQDLAMEVFKDYSACNGTSNMFLAKKYGTKVIGTMAHEICQAMSALESMNHPNYYMLNNWIKVYNTSLGIALTDCYTTDSFLKNFSARFAKLYDGVRHDSGDPFAFINKIVDHYKKLNINPMHKVIVFSDSLDVTKATAIKQRCEGKINCAFGIGTNFTNDFENSPALNIVIKLNSVNNIPVVKLSDDVGKCIGTEDAVRVMKYIHCGTPLDTEK